MEAKAVAEQLRAAGVVVQRYSEATEVEDGEVVITDQVCVQVGADYMNVIRRPDSETFEFYPEASNLEQLVRDIHKACAEAT